MATTKPSIPAESAEARQAVRRNIEAVAKLEAEFDRSRSLADRVADRVATFSGTVAFVGVHAGIFGVWIVWNLGLIPGARKFDPFPFLLLSVAVSLEAIFLSTFVLMKQTRMSKRADQRAHLDLQINLLAEREMTLVLQMLQRISTRLGVRLSDDEIEELSEETSLELLVTEIQEKLPDH